MPTFDEETLSIKRIGMLFAVVCALLTLYATLGLFSAIIVFAILAAGDRWMQRRRRLRRLGALVHEVSRASKARPPDLNIGVTKYARSFCAPGDHFPPYIDRPEDEKVRGALAEHRIAILEGPRHAGKSRTAFEAVRRTRRLRLLAIKQTVVEMNPLQELLEDPSLIPRHARVAIFIDRLEQYLTGVDRQTLERWCESHPRAVLLASIDTEHRQAVEDPAHPGSKNAGTLLVDDWLVRIEEELSGSSREKAIATYERPEAARIGPFLAGSTRVISHLEDARHQHPLAFGLTMAAIEAVRGGVSRGLLQSELVELAKLSGLISDRTTSAEVEAAISACTEEADGVMAMLLIEGTGEKEEPILRVNSVLVDASIGREGQHTQLRSLSQSAWLALSKVFAEDGDDAIAIGYAALGAASRAEDPQWLWGFAIDLLSSEVAASDSDREKSRQAMALARDAALAQFGKPSPQEQAIMGPHPDVPSEEEIEAASKRFGGAEDELFNAKLPPVWPPPPFYAKTGRRNLIRFSVLALCDVVALAAALGAATALAQAAFAGSVAFGSLLQGAIGAAPLTIVLYAYLGLYRPSATRARLSEIVKGLSIVAFSLVLVAFAEGFVAESLLLIALAWLVAIFVDLSLRTVYDFISRRWVVKRGLSARTLFVVSPERARQLAEVVRRTSKRPMQFVGFVSDRRVGDPAQLATTANLKEVVTGVRVERVILADPSLSAKKRGELAALCHLWRVAVELLPGVDEILQQGGDAIADVSVPLIELPPLYLSRFNARMKRTADLLLGGIFFLLVWWWLFGAIYLLLAILGGGSPLIRTTRLGRHRPFSMYRLRVSDGTRPAVATQVNPHLERFKVDELPQLLNVLKGEMSLVGPRPLTATKFRQLPPRGRLRYAVKPGLTGLWQISSWRSSRRESEYQGMLGELELMAILDLIYCRRWSPLLDLTIVLRTPVAVLSAPWLIRPGATPRDRRSTNEPSPDRE